MFKEMELEFFRIFVSESRELIEEVELQLISTHEEAERTGVIDASGINGVFRLFHTMKGSAGSLGLNNIASLTHKAETLLDIIRSGKASFQAEHVDLLMAALDLTRGYLDLVERNNSDKGREEERVALEKKLSDMIQSASGQTSASASVKPGAPARTSTTQIKPEPKQTKEPTEKSDAKIVESPKSAAAAESAGDKQPDGSAKPLIEQFVEEASDILDRSEKILLELEKNPATSSNQIRELFRGMHSFKGNCGFLGQEDLESLSHKAETVLEQLLDGQIELIPEHLMTFLIVVDTLRQGIGNLAASGNGSFDGKDNVFSLLDQMSNSLIAMDKSPKKLGQILVEEGAVSTEQLASALDKQQATIGEVLVDMGATDPATIEKALEKQAEQAEQVAKPASADKLPSIKRSDIRVDLMKLDKLVNLVGELVIAETMVTRNPDLRDLTLENFDRAVHHLRRVTSELQDVAMSVRMIPLSMTFQKLVRVVHDLSRKVKKKVKLTLIGEETEVDKTMTEQIADPLLHMVRNSVDHGLESPEERLKIGKPETGRITIEARYEGGEVWIIVSDDGRGLNREKILAKAVEKGLFKGDPSHISDEEVFAFIFEPGFSTSTTISEVSGRGVGMDVVRKNIEKLKGRISIRSRFGYGTSIYLQIPLTLAIIDGMLVKVGDSQYTVPLLSIRESVRPTAKAITITPEGEEIVRIREDMIPVIRLHKLHNKEPRFTDLHEGILVIVEDQGRKAAIFVDEIIGQQQTVIKGLSNFISMVQGISGCTILGDGAVSLILDIGGLIEKAGDINQKFY